MASCGQQGEDQDCTGTGDRRQEHQSSANGQGGRIKKPVTGIGARPIDERRARLEHEIDLSHVDVYNVVGRPRAVLHDDRALLQRVE